MPHLGLGVFLTSLRNVAAYSDFSQITVALKKILLSAKAKCCNGCSKDGFGDKCLRFASVRPLGRESEHGPKILCLALRAWGACWVQEAAPERKLRQKKKKWLGGFGRIWPEFYAHAIIY